MSGVGRGRLDWDDEVHKRPSAIAVANLHDSHGFAACCERWSWLSPPALNSLVRAGRRQLERRQA